MTKRKLIEGITYDEKTKKFNFDWKQDTNNDLVKLKFQRYNKSLSVKRGYSVYYSYKFNRDIYGKDIAKLFKISLKNIDSNYILAKDVDLLVSKAVINFDNLEDLSSYDLIVTPKSDSPILKLFVDKIQAKVGKSVKVVSNVFVKMTFENIGFDEDKLNKIEKTEREKIIKILKKVFSTDQYKIRSLPPRFRKFVLQFLTFKSDTDRSVFNSIIDGKVLLVDDLLTEGTTFGAMADLILSKGAKSVTGFVLLAEDK